MNTGPSAVLSDVSNYPSNASHDSSQKQFDSIKDCWALISGRPFEASHRPPLVSIIITAHNYARFLEQTIKSVYAQRYSEFECIIVNDASTDDTVYILETLLDSMNDRRFLVVNLTENVGQLGAEAEGLAKAKGSFVVFLDADDLLHPQFIERHLYAHLHLPLSAGFTSSDQWNIDENGAVLSFHHADFTFGWRSQISEHLMIGDDERAIQITYLASQKPSVEFRWLWGTQSTMVFRRALLDLIIPPSAEAADFRICADYYLVRFAQMLTGSALLGESLGSYRRHGANNFCSNMLLAENISVGDMRFHPKGKDFDRLAFKILNGRREIFLSLFGEHHYLKLRSYFDSDISRNKLLFTGRSRWKA